MGVGIRVLAGGCWGFAATDDLTPAGIEAAAALALEIARAGAAARKHEVALAPEDSLRGRVDLPLRHRPVLHPRRPQSRRRCSPWTANCAATPASGWPRRPMHFERRRQVFASTLGSVIDQTRTTIRRRLLRPQLQGRRDPEALLPEFLRRPVSAEGLRAGRRAAPAGERAAHRRGGGGAALRRPVPGRRVRPDPGQLAARPADSRIHRPPHRARPRAGQRGQLRRHELPHARPAEPACATARRSSTWCATRASSTVPAWAPSPSTTKACRRSAPTSSATACSPAT